MSPLNVNKRFGSQWSRASYTTHIEADLQAFSYVLRQHEPMMSEVHVCIISKL